MGLSRRGLLAGAAGTTVLGAGVVVDHANPGVRRHLKAFFETAPHVPLPTESPGRPAGGSFPSAAMGGRRIGWRLSYPPGHAADSALPVCIAMPGRGANEHTAFDTIGLDRFLARVVSQGTPPFVVASVDGGDHSYWHKRADGDDPQTMLERDFLPVLADLGLATKRFGMLGWSMGGFGALLIAERLGASRVAAVAVSSPALWRKASETPDGAFDSAEDFSNNDVFAGRPHLAGVPIRVSCGDADPFYSATKAFIAGVPSVRAAYFGPGGHTDAFWRQAAPDHLAFIGKSLH